MQIETKAEKQNLLMGCLITNVYDLNRNTILEDDNYALVKDWAESISDHKLQGRIFHTNFSEETCKKFSNAYITFHKITHNPTFNPNIFRYFVYHDFLKQHLHQYQQIFVTDISDVTLINNPFIDPIYTENPSALFCGDEPKTLNDSWMLEHATHLRNNIPDFAAFETTFAQETLLNCGIIGGNATLFFQFIEKLCGIHQQANTDNKTAFTGDMGAFNYLARTQFNEQLIHGAPVNTVFKQYENTRTDCWFRHK
jgi:hypothetical protein